VPPDALEQALHARLSGFDGEVGLWAKDLGTGREVGRQADRRFPAASVIKLAVLAEAYERFADGSLDPALVLLLPEERLPGVLGHLHPGLPLTVGDLLELMVVVSDNTATNLLVDHLGVRRINDRMRGYGLPDTRIFRGTFRVGRAEVDPELEREYGLGMSTPRETGRLLERIATGQVGGRAAGDEMVAMLSRQQDRSMIPRRLPADAEVANKPGRDAEKLAGPDGRMGHVRADAAIVTHPKGHYVLAILVRRIADTSWGVDNAGALLGADLARLVHEHLAR
jgi:beta-lactamase class A